MKTELEIKQRMDEIRQAGSRRGGFVNGELSQFCSLQDQLLDLPAAMKRNEEYIRLAKENADRINRAKGSIS